MEKIVRKWGDSLIVSFNSEEQKIHNIKKGCILDLSDMRNLTEERRFEDTNKICREMENV